MRFVSQALLLSVVILLFFLVATTEPSLAQGQNAPTDGAGLFKSKCAMCHGPDGAGLKRLWGRNSRSVICTPLRSRNNQMLSYPR